MTQPFTLPRTDNEHIRKLIGEAVRERCRALVEAVADELLAARHADLESVIRADERQRILRLVHEQLGSESAALVANAIGDGH